jgi:hypothetical protein
VSGIYNGVVDALSNTVLFAGYTAASSLVLVNVTTSLNVVQQTTITSYYSGYPVYVLALDSAYAYVSYFPSYSSRQIQRLNRGSLSGAVSVTPTYTLYYIIAAQLSAAGVLTVVGSGGLTTLTTPGMTPVRTCLAFAAATSSVNPVAAGFGPGVAYVVRYGDTLGRIDTWTLPSLSGSGSASAVCPLNNTWAFDVGATAATNLVLDTQAKVGYAACSATTSSSYSPPAAPVMCAFPLPLSSAFTFLPLWPSNITVPSNSYYTSTAIVASTLDTLNGRLYAASTSSSVLPSLFEIAAAAGPGNLSMTLLQSAVVPSLSTMTVRALLVDGVQRYLYLSVSATSGADSYGHIYQVPTSQLATCCATHILAPRTAYISSGFILGGSAYLAGVNYVVSPYNTSVASMSLAAPLTPMTTSSLAVNRYALPPLIVPGNDGETAFVLQPAYPSSYTAQTQASVTRVDFATLSTLSFVTLGGGYTYSQFDLFYGAGVVATGSTAGNVVIGSSKGYSYAASYLLSFSPYTSQTTTFALPSTFSFGANGFALDTVKGCASTPTATESNGATLPPTATSSATATAFPSIPPLPSESAVPTTSATASASATPTGAFIWPSYSAPPSAAPLPTSFVMSASPGVPAGAPAGTPLAGAAIGGVVGGFVVGIAAAAGVFCWMRRSRTLATMRVPVTSASPGSGGGGGGGTGGQPRHPLLALQTSGSLNAGSGYYVAPMLPGVLTSADAALAQPHQPLLRSQVAPAGVVEAVTVGDQQLV